MYKVFINIFQGGCLNMSKVMVCTPKELKTFLKTNVSVKRYEHSLGVAQTTSDILIHYNLSDYDKTYKNFDAPFFCGIAHDVAREMSDGAILDYCKKNHIVIPKEDIENPILAHGLVSAEIVRTLVGSYPMSWYKALCVHTTGNTDMDSLSLALFVADFIEPGRRYMTEEKRTFYLSSESLQLCAYRVLCDMINHWESTGVHSVSRCSLAMKRQLEIEYGCIYGL